MYTSKISVHSFISLSAHHAGALLIFFPSPSCHGFLCRTFFRIPLPLSRFRKQVVLPPVAFVPMALSQAFALAISILLPLIAHWTWSWVNGLALNWLEKISFSLSKLNKNKEIKLNPQVCLNISRVVTWGRKPRDKADDQPTTSERRGTLSGTKARKSATT